jgi:hypothetical protein
MDINPGSFVISSLGHIWSWRLSLSLFGSINSRDHRWRASEALNRLKKDNRHRPVICPYAVWIWVFAIDMLKFTMLCLKLSLSPNGRSCGHGRDSFAERRRTIFCLKSRLWNLRQIPARDCTDLAGRLMRVTLFHGFNFILLTILSLTPSGHFQSFLQWLDHTKSRSDLSKSDAVVVLVTPAVPPRSTYFCVSD